MSVQSFARLIAVAALFVFPSFVSAATVNVDITDNLYSPRNITITTGDTVVWTHRGSVMHTVTADDGSFNSGNMSAGQTFSQAFSAPGTFRYYCIPHGAPGGVGQSGVITVQAAGASSAGTGVVSNPTYVAQPVTYVQQPTAVSSDDALRAQVQDLLNRITSMQQQVLGGGGGVPAYSGGVPRPAGAVPAAQVQCPYISRSLKKGSQGDDVLRLQRFLALDPAIYPEARATGYYGELTEAAVKRFQCKFKIVCAGTPAETGYGVTGPRTAALLALQCPELLGEGRGNVGGFIRVTPVSGNAPLAVSVEAVVNTTQSCTGAVYELDFGDNTNREEIRVTPQVCTEVRQTFNHTYAAAGRYTVTLRSGTHQTFATVNVTGGGVAGGADSISATPTGGPPPLTVTFKGLVNAKGACNAGPYVLDFGDGQTAPIPITGCAAGSYTVTHVYTGQGNFLARLSGGAAAQDIGSVAVAVGGGGAQSQPTQPTGGYGSYFAVTPSTSGDAYSVDVQFEIASPCTAYRLDWGDGSGSVSQNQGSCAPGAASKQFSHEYSSAGSYTIVLKRGEGLVSTDSASVTITE